MNTLILNTCKDILESLSETSFLRDGEIASLNGSYHCDCSSYINSILKLIDENLYIELLGSERRLKAKDYFELTNSRATSHNKISKIIPGEILVWKKKNPPNSGDTGHMAIVLESPIEVSKDRWKVRVSDSSKQIHDNDSRAEYGVGSGEIILITDNDSITGYIWSSSVKKNKITDVLCMSFSKSLIE